MTASVLATQPPRASVGLLRHADFLRLWTGQTVSRFGSQVSLLAIPLIAITMLGATAFEVGALNAAEALPFLLIGLPAGAWVDRVRRRRVLVVADAGRAVALASIPVAAALGVLSLTQLYVVALVTGFLTVFFDVAYLSYVPSLVGPDQLADANAKLETTSSAAQVAGPGIGGALVQFVSAPYAVAADALSFVVSLVCVLAIRRSEPDPRANHRGDRTGVAGIAQDVAEGLRHVLGQPHLRSLAIGASLLNVFTSMFGAVVLLFAVRELRLDAGTIGAVLAFGNLGLFGALGASAVTARFGLGHTLVVTIVLTAVGVLAIAATPREYAVPWLVGALLLLSATSMIFNVDQLTLRQAITPPQLQGRMHATVRFLAWGAIPVGAMLGGWLGGEIGLRETMWVAGAGGLLAVLTIVFSPVRSLRTIAEAMPAGAVAGGAAPGAVG